MRRVISLSIQSTCTLARFKDNKLCVPENIQSNSLTTRVLHCTKISGISRCYVHLKGGKQVQVHSASQCNPILASVWNGKGPTGYNKPFWGPTCKNHPGFLQYRDWVIMTFTEDFAVLGVSLLYIVHRFGIIHHLVSERWQIFIDEIVLVLIQLLHLFVVKHLDDVGPWEKPYNDWKRFAFSSYQFYLQLKCHRQKFSHQCHWHAQLSCFQWSHLCPQQDQRWYTFPVCQLYIVLDVLRVFSFSSQFSVWIFSVSLKSSWRVLNWSFNLS